jgi:DNA modification methylase
VGYTLHLGDCLDILPTIPATSVDAVICDPPYPEISRDYGRMTEDEWWAMMMGVCAEVRRVLKPSGSAVFILQPNSRKVGSMRGWLWRFMWWVTTDWNMVQDAYWWNVAQMPQGSEVRGLMRSSLKPCIWAGNADCYRAQRNVLWSETFRNAQLRAASRRSGDGDTLRYSPSGAHGRELVKYEAAERRGGVTPFNVLPIASANNATSAGAYGHGAGTPPQLADWWTRYIVPPGGTVLDPFNGAGTMGVAALQNGAHYIGIEKMAKYVDVSHERLAKVQPALVEAAD